MSITFMSGQDLCGLRLFIDSNIAIDAFDREREQAKDLIRLHNEGWISLGRTDVMDTERTQGQPPEIVAQRMEQTADLPESFGPFVFNHSRFDHSVFASEEDKQRLNSVFAALFPRENLASTTKNKLRDAMHVATAFRYGSVAFVTRDEDLLKKDREINSLLGLRIWSLEYAHREAMSRVAATRARHIRQPERGPLPEWPTA